MSRQLDSGALTLLNEILQLGGGGSQITQLDDENVSQTLDVTSVIRRSLSFANSGGLFYFGYSLVHAGAGVLTQLVDPYTNLSAGVNSFPTVMPRGFDVWLLTGNLRRASGAGALTGASLEVILNVTMRGSGSSITSTTIPVGFWDTLEADTLQDYAVTQSGEPMLKPMLRLRRGMRVQIRTNSTGVATFHGLVIVGAFPAGMGQDVVT